MCCYGLRLKQKNNIDENMNAEGKTSGIKFTL